METPKIPQRNIKVTISLTEEELQIMFDKAAEKARRVVEEEYKKQQAPEAFLTEPQVRKLLNVSEATMWRWKKNGVLVPVQIAGLNRYKKSDIDRLTATN